MDIRENTEPQPEVAPLAGSIATPLNVQPRIESAPPDWCLWLLPLVALMFLASAVAIYFLPTNMDLLVPLSCGLVLAIALLVVVAYRTIPIFTSSVGNAVRHTPDGKFVTWNRFASLISLLLTSILAAALATGGMLVFALATPEISVVSRQVERPFVLLVTSSIVIILLLFSWLARIRPLQEFLQLRFAGAGVLLIPVIIYLALNSWLPPLLYNYSAYTGPFASWPAMVQVARHEADRIDKEAILYDVAVYSYRVNGPYTPQTSPLVVGFRFVRPTGEDISIEVLDTDPVRLLYVIKNDQSLVSSYEYAHERSVDWLSYIKLGPRDAYSLTEKEAITFAQRNGINIAEFRPGLTTSLKHDGAGSTQYGATAVWNIHYMADVTKSLDLYVDGTTGEVLARRPYLYNGTATPAPQPAATASPTP